MIKIIDLTYCYNNSRAEALSHVDTTIGPGIHLLLGENGAGKTTLLSLIGGWLKARPATAVEIDGIPTADREPSVMSQTFMLTDDTVFPFNSIRQMVEYHSLLSRLLVGDAYGVYEGVRSKHRPAHRHL